MKPPKSKSKQVLEYLYRYAIEKGRSEVIEAVVPYGKIGMILWEVGHNVYEIMSNANEEDRLAILNEIQQASLQEIEQLSNELSNDPNVIYPISLSDDERKAVARGIYQTLRQMPKGKINPQQILQSINQGLFAGRNVFSVHNVNASHAQSVGSAVVKTLVNGSGLGFGQKQKVQFLGQYPMIDGFEIKGILGEGAYARVYLANEQLGNGKWRTCALKVGVIESEERFKREVQNMQLVNHPHILSCWNTGRFQEQGVAKYWISMPNMGGLTLEHLILGHALDLETKLLILMQMVDGLEALHQKKIVHRDLKPSNCLISSDFELKISDFGLSKDLNSKIDSSQSRNADAIGTPAYMSPENIDGNIGFYSDVWAFGIIAFELFSGNLPWGREIKPLVLTGNIQHKDIHVNKLLAPFKLPQKLVEIVDKCLKREIAQRYRDGSELKSAFYRVAKEERYRLRHNRFRESWLVLIEDQLIESFIQHQVQNGYAEFPLETFLAMPKVAKLPLALDYERLGEVLSLLSKVSKKIHLEQALLAQNEIALFNQNRERLKIEKEAEIQRIDQEMTEGLKLLPHDQIVQMLSKLSELRDQKKEVIHQKFMILDQKMVEDCAKSQRVLEEKIVVIINQFKTEIEEELKDFDLITMEPKERQRILMRNMIGAVITLNLMGGLWIWNERLEEKERMEKLAQEQQKMRIEAEDKANREKNRLLNEHVKTVTTEWEEIRKFWHKKKNSALISAVALFLDKYEKHPLGNPLEAEARKALDDLKTKMDIDKSGINWVLIPGGSFMMGSMDGSSDERPVHRVVVKDFYMSKTEVTVGQYRKCVEAGGCSEPSDKNDNSHCNWGYSDREDHPINCVDWKQARTFAKWVGGDLPSEAQWEYASRSGGKDIKYPWGNAEPRCEIANYHGCGGNTIPVCSKIGGNTTQGLCDMGGNVWEWVLDEYHSSYNGAPSEAIGWCSDRGCDSDTSDIRVYRGGSWDYSDSILRSADRTYHLPALHLYSVGFRVSLVHKRQFIDLEGF